MAPYLILVLLVLPPVAAVACRRCRSDRLLSGLVALTGLTLAIAALGLSAVAQADFKIGMGAGQVVDGLTQVADIGLTLLFLYYGRRYRSRAVLVLAGVQLLSRLSTELLPLPEAGATLPVLRDDGLARIMLLLVNLVGPLICCHALPYMRNHDQHLSTATSTQPRFFFVMLLFMGAMNGLVLANALDHIYFCFELTTLCSFLLIGHDGTDEAKQNAVRALWINSIAGVAFALALLLMHLGGIPPALTGLLGEGAGASSAMLYPAVALLCLAAFVKSAQFPFQRWLLGAMVAPTPVSALLHASTMVKVGIYLMLRLAPLLAGSFMGRCAATYGALVFLGAAALAVGQHNGKKILAYSTISNLGLIFACIGLGTPAALAAAVLLMIFHALTKALLFLCVGTIEQHIHSRDIEDMRGLYAVMPVTALMTVAGVLMMIMPPFGMLLGKWMAMEAAARAVDVILLIVAGSALTVIYWARWAGLLMSEPITVPFRVEKMPVATWSALLALCAGGAAMSVAAPWIYETLVAKALGLTGAVAVYAVHAGAMENAAGRFAVFPLSLLMIGGCIVSMLAFHHASRGRSVSPYLCGEQAGAPDAFRGPMDRTVTAHVGNFYLQSIFGEAILTPWLNTAAVALLILFLGGAR